MVVTVSVVGFEISNVIKTILSSFTSCAWSRHGVSQLCAPAERRPESISCLQNILRDRRQYQIEPDIVRT